MALTPKKRAFADAVFIGKGSKAAAVVAGYSAATAGPAGSRLVKDKDVIAYLAKLKTAAETGGEVEPEPAPKFDLDAAMQHKDPRVFLMAAMNDIELAPKLRIDAAKALMPFEHQKRGEGGKKDGQAVAAKKAGAGRFAPSAPPKLVVNNKGQK